MKKFKFSLEKVLSYKIQIEDNLKGEYAEISKRVLEQEKLINSLEDTVNETLIAIEEEKSLGFDLSKIQMCEGYISMLRTRIEAENKKLAHLKILEEKKLAELLEAKVERSSIENIKDKRIEEYNKEVSKAEEAFIEEFVSNRSRKYIV